MSSSLTSFSVSRALLVCFLGSALLLSACGGRGSKGDLAYVAQDVETLYSVARDNLDQRRYKEAARWFDEVERQHPYSVWARRAQLMGAFSYYMARDYQSAILSARRFLAIHPGNKDAPYAYYLVAVSEYERILDADRDQKTTRDALDAFQELVRRYPDSPYAADARLKIDFVRNQLAAKEIEVGRFYQGQREWLASVGRFRRVVETYDGTAYVPEALERLTESYLALGLREEARRTAAVLGYNYPGSIWYKRAYDLVRRHET